MRRIKYGLTKNIKTFNPLRIGYQEFVDIARDVRTAKGLRPKLNYVFKHPGWTPEHSGGQAPSVLTDRPVGIASYDLGGEAPVERGQPTSVVSSQRDEEMG